jgi:hypothetical protein
MKFNKDLGILILFSWLAFLVGLIVGLFIR